MNFEIISNIENIETIAEGSSIREIGRLRKCFGKGNWEKLKGKAKIRFSNGRIRLTELRDYLINSILEKIPETFLNGHPTDRLPNNANISFLNV